MSCIVFLWHFSTLEIVSKFSWKTPSINSWILSMVNSIGFQCCNDLVQISNSGRITRAGRSAKNLWEQSRGKDTNNGNHNKKLNEGKTLFCVCHFKKMIKELKFIYIFCILYPKA